MKIGDKIFWRWKEHKKAYDEGIIVGVNQSLIAIGRSQYSEARNWLDVNELDIIKSGD